MGLSDFLHLGSRFLDLDLNLKILLSKIGNRGLPLPTHVFCCSLFFLIGFFSAWLQLFARNDPICYANMRMSSVLPSDPLLLLGSLLVFFFKYIFGEGEERTEYRQKHRGFFSFRKKCCCGSGDEITVTWFFFGVCSYLLVPKIPYIGELMLASFVTDNTFDPTNWYELIC